MRLIVGDFVLKDGDGAIVVGGERWCSEVQYFNDLWRGAVSCSAVKSVVVFSGKSEPRRD